MSNRGIVNRTGKITFTRGSVTVLLPAPSAPLNCDSKLQVLGRTAGGITYYYDKGAEIQATEMSLNGLTSADKDALTTFFRTTANGIMNTFTFTDSAGTARTVKFLAPELNFEKSPANAWRVKFNLALL